jgi:carboxymethylenebutenolidase
MGETVTFAADGGTCEGYLARPASRGRGVVVIQEWWGLDDHIRSIADRFAAEGFAAVAPDLYHGTVTRSPDEAGKLAMALDVARAEADLRGAIRFLREDTGRPVGTVGFCMGGTLSLYAACANGADVGACVLFYGGHPKAPYYFDGLRAPVLGHWAENDPGANANAASVEAALRERGKPFEFHRYPGTRHAFFNDTRPQVHDPGAAALAWQRTLAFLRSHLTPPA